MAALDLQLTLQRSATASLTYMESEVNFHNRMNVFFPKFVQKGDSSYAQIIHTVVHIKVDENMPNECESMTNGHAI